MSARKAQLGPRRLLDYDGLAHYLSIGRSKAFEIVAAGEIRKVAIGSLVRFDVADVDAYVERLKKAS